MPRKKSSSSLKEDLFGDVPDAVSAPSLTINKGFARSFEERKTRQELGRAREFGITANGAAGGGEESMSEDDTGEALDAAMDARISATIDAIRRRDPRVYVPEARFFEGEKKSDSDSDSNDDDDNARAAASILPPTTTSGFVKLPTTKTKTARDTLRQQLLSAAEEGKTDAFGDDDEDESRARAADAARAANPRAYDEEQRALRRAFLDIKAEGKGGENDSDDDDDSGLLRVKPRDEASEAAAIAEALRDREVLRAAMKTKGGKTALHGDQVADPDAFLATFLKSNAWRVMERDNDNDNDNDDNDVVGGGMINNVAVKTTTIPDSEDEEEVWKAEDFEAGYNFRFEEKGGGAIVTHARGAAAAAGSLRRKDTGRADERGRKAERSAEIKAAADADARRLMNLKRAEHKNRITRIQETAGAGVDMAGLAAALGTDALDGDFDPEAHDAAMAALFGDDYYGVEEMEGGGGGEGEEITATTTTMTTKTKKKSSKPAPWVWGDGPRPAWAGPSAEELAEGVDDGLGDIVGRDIDGDDDIQEDDGDGEGVEEEDGAVLGSRALRRARKLGRRAKGVARRMGAVARARASIAAEDAARARMLPSVGGAGGGGGGRIDDPDEVLALGFEDVIAGGLRTRFHYTSVPADSFGLSAEEILAADDSELNGYVGLRRLAPFRETPWHVPPYLAKQGVGAIKRAIAARIEASGENKANVIGGTKRDFESGEEVEGDKKKKRRKDKTATVAAAAVEEEGGEDVAHVMNAGEKHGDDTVEEDDTRDARRAAKKALKKARKAAATAGMDEAEIQRISRLKSYGLK